LQEFDRRRRTLLRDTSLLTRFVLGMARRPFWARQTLRLMHASPDLYGHLVGVAGGTRPLLPARRLRLQTPVDGHAQQLQAVGVQVQVLVDRIGRVRGVEELHALARGGHAPSIIAPFS
jgi:hypothetical protein